METELELITAVFIILACALAIQLLGRRVKLPIIIGYFITGIVVGPYGLGLINESEVSMLAELGVILLMFTIGLEISLKNLLSMKKVVLVGGALQLCLTTAAVWAILVALGFQSNTALFIGFLVAPSSTAIIMSLYQQTGDIDSPHGKIALGLLIFQDICVIPMMLMVPILAGNSTKDLGMELLNLGAGMIVLGLVLVAAIIFVPRLLTKVASVRNQELFVITIVVICFGIAWIMSLNGVDLALGAFLAGVAISESEYSYEIIGQVMPIRDILTSFFFVSVGMMLNISFLTFNALIIVAIAVVLLFGKTIINFISLKAIGVMSAVAFVSAAGISQIGEFSFILGVSGLQYGIVDNGIYQVFLTVSIITMALTPYFVNFAPPIAKKYLARDLTASSAMACEVCETGDAGEAGESGDGRDASGAKAGGACAVNAQSAASAESAIAPVISEASAPVKRSNYDNPYKKHVIVVGYGICGQFVVKALKKTGLKYVILELNPNTVATEKKNGEEIIYGDASRDTILNHVKVSKAGSIVVTIPNGEVTKAIITTARRMNPNIYIIARVRFISDIAELYRLGTDEVIVDERESAIEIFKRTILNGNVITPEFQKELDICVKQMRSELYDRYLEKPMIESAKETIGGNSAGFHPLLQMIHTADRSMPKSKNSIKKIVVCKDSYICGKRLSEVSIRGKYGVSVVAVKRAENTDAELTPDGDTVLYEGDTAIIVGEIDQIEEIRRLFTEVKG
ncbi:MAG: cation:proton antiporter [Methanomicrobium sp.]|nr:cation:proton antiporter [Methanomicrobium sp.]